MSKGPADEKANYSSIWLNVCGLGFFKGKFAVGNVEDFAEEKGYDIVTVAVVEEQMENAGMGRFKRKKTTDGETRRRWWWPFGG